MNRKLFKYVLDLAVWTLMAPLAFVLRLEEGVGEFVPELVVYTAAAAGLKAVVLLWLRLDRRAWRWTGVGDLLALTASVGVVMVVLLAGTVWTHAGVGGDGFSVPRSIPLIEALLSLGALSALRVLVRVVTEQPGKRRARRDARRVLLIGAGTAGAMAARELLRHPEAGIVPVAFLDDDPKKARERIVGLPVLGRIDALERAVEETGADEVIVTLPSATGELVRRVVMAARAAGVPSRTIPALHDLISGRIAISQIREIDVEDLLGRDPVRLDAEAIARSVRGKVVLVTGAGGSIGSEIVRQIAPFSPARVILLGRGENSIYQIDRELGRRVPGLARHAVICDVRDGASLRAVFERFRPDVIFHAAAHKHVPLMEANPEQAVFNNVGGTRNLAELALEFGAERLVNISTDKAVNPTNVMGASKRAAELVVADAAARSECCVFVSVRFGNVLGSRGSVVPLFRDQIRRGGPVTVTHPDMVRYFMTIPEASQLVLQAGAIAESGRVYVLDMGDPVRIQDLARDLILLSGLEPGQDIEIEFSGARPGEKLFEELLTSEDGTEPSPHEKIFVARKTVDRRDLHSGLDALFEAAHDRDDDAVRAAFQRLVPSYAPESAAPEGSTGATAAWVSGGDGATEPGAPPAVTKPASPLGLG